MEFLRKNSLVVLIIILVVIVFWGYNNFFATDEEMAIEGEAVVEENPLRSEVLRQLAKLQSLTNIEGTLFANPVFQSFVEVNASVPNDEAGRENPFAPIGTR